MDMRAGTMQERNSVTHGGICSQITHPRSIAGIVTRGEDDMLAVGVFSKEYETLW